MGVVKGAGALRATVTTLHPCWSTGFRVSFRESKWHSSLECGRRLSTSRSLFPRLLRPLHHQPPALELFACCWPCPGTTRPQAQLLGSREAGVHVQFASRQRHHRSRGTASGAVEQAGRRVCVESQAHRRKARRARPGCSLAGGKELRSEAPWHRDTGTQALSCSFSHARAGNVYT